MALTPAQKKQLKKFVTSHYAPKLRRGALKKFSTKAEKSGLGFIKNAGKKKGGPKAPAPTPGPYDRYKKLPGNPVQSLTDIDRMSTQHQDWAKQVQGFTGQMINPISAAASQANQYYSALGGQYAQMGALPAQMPTATVGGQVVTPGTATPALQGATIQGQATAAAGTQAATYQGFIQDRAQGNLAQGIQGHLGSLAQQIPGMYNEKKTAYLQRLDEMLFEQEQAEKEASANAALEELKMANDRYIAQLGLVGDMTGEQTKLQLGQLQSDTDLATNAADNTTRAGIAQQTNQTRANIAAMNNATRRATARYKGAIDLAKVQVQRAKNATTKKTANQKLLREVQKAFDALWKGEAPDPLKPGSGHGWRYTARGGSKGREKAAVQVLGWLQTTGLAPGNIHRLMRSKGFSDREFQRAVRIVEGGGGF